MNAYKLSETHNKPIINPDFHWGMGPLVSLCTHLFSDKQINTIHW